MLHNLGLLMVSTLLVSGAHNAAHARDEPSSKSIAAEIQDLKQGQERLLQMLTSLTLKLTPPRPEPKVRGVSFELTGTPIRGSDAARIILLEFSDYQCPFCSRYLRETFPRILAEYVDTGRIAYSVVNRPLPSHPLAQKAAEAAFCAHDQGRFWQMHELLMSKQDELRDLPGIAKQLNLNVSLFETCLQTNRHAVHVGRDAALGSQLNVLAVPVFVLGLRHRDAPSNVEGLSFISGAQPFEAFKKELDQALTGTGSRAVRTGVSTKGK